MSGGMPKIGFLGTGLMGGPMVARLLEAGYPVTVWNRTRDKLAQFVDKGAVAANTPLELANSSDLIMMCLMDTNAVETVVFGDDGIAQSTNPDILVDFSTLPPQASRDFTERLMAANAMTWIDAPVSGGVPGARAGTLAIMAGGDAAAIEKVRPVVEILSARFTRMGGPGSGQATKLCNQIISGCTMAIVAEAVNFAQKSGVDATILTEALRGGFADSIPFQLLAPRMAARNFENPLGAADTMLKDLNAVEECANINDAQIPMTTRAIEILRDTQANGDGGKDISTIIRYFDREH